MQLFVQELFVESCPESQELHAGSFNAPMEQVELGDIRRLAKYTPTPAVDVAPRTTNTKMMILAVVRAAFRGVGLR